MPSKIVSFKKRQREYTIKTVLKEFRNRPPEMTPQEELRDVIFSWLSGLGIPTVAILIVLAIKLNFITIFSDAPFILFFTPVILSSWLAGVYSGIVATILGAFFAFYIFTPPSWSMNFDAKNETLLITYLIEGILISYFIANQRKAQTQAEAVQLSFNLLLENTLDYGIIFLNPMGYITNANSGAHRLTGYTNQEIKGVFFAILFTDEDRGKKLPEKEFTRALRTGRSTDENYLQRKNGDRFFASGFTTPLWTESNQLYGFVKFFRDVTEGKRQEQEKEDFISIAAHELKNPVASTNLYLQLLHKYYQTHPDQEPQNYLQKAVDQLQRLLDLITTLLDVSQIQKGYIALAKEKVNINHLVKEIIETVQTTEEKHKIVRRGTIKHKVMVDRRKIEEVLINLINNAIKYSPNTKSIIIKLEEKKSEILVSVTDFGIGMTEEVSAKVFERFYRGRRKQTENIQGLGLGLYISSQIVHAHGGNMYVSSRVGKGSTFSFHIPIK